MGGFWKSLIAVVCALAPPGAGVSIAENSNPYSGITPSVQNHHARAIHSRTLNGSDRSSVIAVALHSRKVPVAGRDCSHLVHAIYARAGFPYRYADSEDLYDGVGGFSRVPRPSPADLVVWHGHVGIVVKPSKHQFFSMLSTGPGLDDYRSRYWKTRGQPRFYRYVKGTRR